MSQQPVLAPIAGERSAAESRAEPSERIDPRALRAWRVSGAISLTVAVVVAAAAMVGFWYADLAWYIVALPLVPVLLIAVIEVWLAPEIRWRRWRYEVTERDIELMRGLVTITRTLIPMARVQHVDTKQGPILRHYGLASVQIATAAGTQEIPALSNDVADQLRVRISELAGVSEDV